MVTTSASQTGRHALRPSAIEAHGACTKERSHSPRSFPSFVFFSFFPFLSPSFISCPPFCSPRQPFSSPFSFPFFFFLYSRNRTRDNRQGNEYTNASSFLSRYTFGDITSFFRVQLFATSSFHGPRRRWHFEFAASFVRDVFACAILIECDVSFFFFLFQRKFSWKNLRSLSIEVEKYDWNNVIASFDY